MLDLNDANRLKRSIRAIERAVKAHHQLLTDLAHKHRGLFKDATDGQMQTLSGGTDKDGDGEDDDEQP